MDYITVAEVDAELGSAWAADDAAKKRAVMLVNLWLGSYGLIEFDAVPDAVKAAAFELISAAVAGELYAEKQTGVLSERVKADSVEVETTYNDKASSTSAWLQIVSSLLSPFTKPATTYTLVHKL